MLVQQALELLTHLQPPALNCKSKKVRFIPLWLFPAASLGSHTARMVVIADLASHLTSTIYWQERKLF